VPMIASPKPAPLKPPELMPPVITVQAALPLALEQLSPFVALNVNPGDTPMIRNWKMVAFYSLFTSALGQAPMFAGEKEVKKDEIIERLQKLQKSADDIKDDVKGLKTEVSTLQANFLALSKDVGSNKLRIDDLENQIKDLRIRLGLVSGSGGLDKAAWDELKAKLASIEQNVLRLSPTEVRKAMSPPLTSAGRVVLVNVYGERLMFTLNGKSYTVEPNTTLPIEGVPAGALAYEVRSPTFGLVSRANTNLVANDTFTLTAR
jgi:hypothetical protein